MSAENYFEIFSSVLWELHTMLFDHIHCASSKCIYQCTFPTQLFVLIFLLLFFPPPTYPGPFELLHPSTQRVLSNPWVCPTLIKIRRTLLLAAVNCQYLFHKEWDLCTPHSILDFWLAWTCPGPKQSIMAIISSLISVQKYFFPPVIHHFCFWPLPSFCPHVHNDSWLLGVHNDPWLLGGGAGSWRRKQKMDFFFFLSKRWILNVSTGAVFVAPSCSICLA